jgi:MFS family permease
VLYFIGSLGSALAWDWYSFLLFRLLGGMAVGSASVISPLYIAEISPARFRGRLVAIMQFNVVLGILIAFLSNYLIARLYPGPSEWRWMLGVQAIPSAAFFFLLLAVPESPRWLIARGRDDEARTVFGRMAVIDQFGRRRLIIIGSVGYVISLGTTAWAFYSYGTGFTRTGSLIVLAGLLLFQASHAFGQGAVIWVFISEIFPNRVRARGQALGSATHWAMAALVSWTFPIIARGSGGHAFAFYTAMMCVQLVWALSVMPETKGVPLEEIQKHLGIE